MTLALLWAYLLLLVAHLACVHIDGSSAIDMATGSGSEMPVSPVCTRYAAMAVLLHSMAKRASGVPMLSTCSISAESSTAASRQSCQPTSSMGRAERATIRAASGSTQMLYSAAGVTLPSQHGAPPITTARPTFAAIS